MNRRATPTAAAPSTLLLAALLAVASAASGEEPEEPPVRGALTSGGSYWVEWAPDPHPLPLNEVFGIRFRVLDPRDRETPIANAVLTADARMPEHNHGMHLEPQIEVHGDGTATGDGFLFHMEGRWELGVGVAVEGRMERATFVIDVEP